ncbi:MAG: FAD-binding protein [Actinobacteria bacterium]|nr:FAD-binding protein [Cyanobacteriota bacterium]MCL5771539.1 FAD-binding protein [Actinomycetota bacterium]
MGKLLVHQDLVNDETANKLIKLCPFGAIEYKDGKLEINAGCKMCRICIKKGPKGVIEFVEEQTTKVDKSAYKGIAVYVDHVEGRIHPVTFELIGKAKELAKKVNYPVYCIFPGFQILDSAEELLHYGADEVFIYDYVELEHFRIEPYTAVFEDFINNKKPSIILIGATTIGRSLAPRVAARFRTGLTADCTVLDIKENSDLVQIRPAFGGNIMAQIVTPNSRPQLATVRYKIMNAPERTEEVSGKITVCSMDTNKFKSNVDVIKITKKEIEGNISESEIIVVAGRAIKTKKDMSLAYELAEVLGGNFAGTRPMVEAGWIDAKKQIGLSGRTVKPKLIITLGVSGAVQFTAGMKSADYIFAINKDPKAAIFSVAHYGIIGDIYEIVPKLIENIKNEKGLTGELPKYAAPSTRN